MNGFFFALRALVYANFNIRNKIVDFGGLSESDFTKRQKQGRQLKENEEPPNFSLFNAF